MEFTNGVDLVSEEFDTHRMGQCRWKHVDDSSTHREFPTVHHQINARIGILDQSSGSLVERELLTLGENQRFDVSQSGHHRLDQGTYRHDENPDGTEHIAAVPRMLQPTEHRHTARHRVRSGGKPLVRQRLPCLKLRNIIRVPGIPGTNRLDRFLGLTAGSHHQYHGSAAGRSCGQCRTQTFRHPDRDAGIHVGLRRFDSPGNQRTEIIIRFKDVQDARQGTGRRYRLSGH